MWPIGMRLTIAVENLISETGQLMLKSSFRFDYNDREVLKWTFAGDLPLRCGSIQLNITQQYQRVYTTTCSAVEQLGSRPNLSMSSGAVSCRRGEVGPRLFRNSWPSKSQGVKYKARQLCIFTSCNLVFHYALHFEPPGTQRTDAASVLSEFGLVKSTC